MTATERLAKRMGRKLQPVGSKSPNTSRPKQSPENSIWSTMEKKQLILELQSLREAYARKIAETELKYEKKLQDVEDEAEKWLQQKKNEVTQIRAGMVVMQALFEQRKHKFIKQMEEDRAHNARLKVEMEQRIAAAEQEIRDTKTACDKKVVELEASHSKKFKDLDFLQRQTEERAMRAERAVKVGEDEISRLHEVEKTCRFEIEDLRVRLQDAERAEELHRCREKVEFLEEELRKTRERMQNRRHNEAEDLRKELMEYVKFIVKILPEDSDWQERLQPELCQKLGVTRLPPVAPEVTLVEAALPAPLQRPSTTAETRRFPGGTPPDSEDEEC